MCDASRSSSPGVGRGLVPRRAHRRRVAEAGDKPPPYEEPRACATRRGGGGRAPALRRGIVGELPSAGLAEELFAGLFAALEVVAGLEDGGEVVDRVEHGAAAARGVRASVGAELAGAELAGE